MCGQMGGQRSYVSFYMRFVSLSILLDQRVRYGAAVLETPAH
jgi:hypothetical protein